MAFSSTQRSAADAGVASSGNEKIHRGTWDGDSATTGDIDTGLEVCNSITLQASGSSIVADAPTLNETLPVDGSAVTIIFTSGTDGHWEAKGF